MKLPNNFGSISRLSGNRRRPYIVRKSGTIVGYFATHADALNALCAYNKCVSPIPIVSLVTLFTQWISYKKQSIAPPSISAHESAFKHLAPIAHLPIDTLKYSDFQSIIDNMTTSHASKKKVKSLITQLCTYAQKHEYNIKQYGLLLDIGKNAPIHPHKPFTRQQINKLWNAGTSAYGALILLYTGMRVGELLNLRKRDINLKTRCLTVTKSKTEAGTNRVIPIHSRILPIIQQLHASSTDYIYPLTYSQFATEFKRVTNNKHTTHDCRHTVATLLDSAGASPTATRAILGHKHGDITTRVYTHKTIRDLRKAVELLK